MNAWEWWSSIGSPKYIAAPMIDQSWLPWRRLVHNRNCHLSYTPMHHAALIVSNENYRNNVIKDLQDSPKKGLSFENVSGHI